jgi:hypothetical protein
VEYMPASLVTVTGQPVFAPPYTNGRRGDTSMPGLIDEIGSSGGFRQRELVRNYSLTSDSKLMP